jgi:hypothetical protein
MNCRYHIQGRYFLVALFSSTSESRSSWVWGASELRPRRRVDGGGD